MESVGVYLLVWAGGMVFGWAQCRFLGLAMRPSGGLWRWLALPLKLASWALALVLLALQSIWWAVVFTVGASAAMMVYVARLWRKAREEE